MNVLGIMSGTSLDGADYVLCRISDSGRMKLLDHWRKNFSASLRARLVQAASNHATTYEVAQLHHDLGRFYAAGARQKAVRIDLAGLHGQTIFHNPKTPRATLQIGEPAYLAEILRKPVVSNFRAGDIAAGGQGAPLATLFHLHTFGQKERNVAVHNLGGISNVTFIGWRKRATPQILSFDTGPANMLMDLAIQRLTGGNQLYDRDGRLARSGKPSSALLRQWLKHPFFRKAPPKSTGRELFGEPFLDQAFRAQKLSPQDMLATLTQFTAQSIALNYQRHLPGPVDEIILCGGGAKNIFLKEQIAASFQPHTPKITASLEHGWDPQVIEGAAFALLAWRRLHNLPGSLPETTGARGSRLLGQVTNSVPSKQKAAALHPVS